MNAKGSPFLPTDSSREASTSSPRSHLPEDATREVDLSAESDI